MSEYVIANKSDLISIADNLRAKTGSTTTMSLSEMSNNIANISTSSTQESVQPDWNQNDSTAADYIKNRPFYITGTELTSIITEQTVSFELNSSVNKYMASIDTLNLETGKTYRVIFDNVSYDCLAFGNNTVYLGNPSTMGGEDTGEPFIFASDVGRESAVLSYNSSTSHTFSISEITSVYKTIPKECLPPNTVFFYNFTDPAPADEVVTAIELFNAGRANISWNGSRVVCAEYNSNDNSICIVGMYTLEVSDGDRILNTYINTALPSTDEQGNSVYRLAPS